MANTTEYIYLIYHVVHGRPDFVLNACTDLDVVKETLLNKNRSRGDDPLDPDFMERITAADCGIPVRIASGEFGVGARARKVHHYVVKTVANGGGFWLV